MQLSCHLQRRIYTLSPQVTDVKIIFIPFTWDVPWAGEWGGWVIHKFYLRLSTHNVFQHFYQWWVSSLTTVLCNKKLLWPFLGGKQICRYQQKCPSVQDWVKKMLYTKTKGISQTLINNSCYFDYINKHREQHYEQNDQSQDK